ncbi:hypothetical protein [uncultured Litoreibacter sp.]|uniref:hypothetical protein n=1 Tax=uncultured Litoreibacter sp. TaxID=1392394 RepID=UPI00260B1641|nr:hypothetical protein [uncultured Litoreibacter sp.]
MTPEAALATKGWCRFDHDPLLSQWVHAVHPIAAALTRDPRNIEDWLRCGGTWFAGVNVLPNDARGGVGDGPQLCGRAVDVVTAQHGAQNWDRAQVSVIYPRYPLPMEGESAAAFAFRRDRDAAHVDGLLPIGPDRRRHLHEPHGFVLGIPLTETSKGASSMVVWEGRHKIMQAAFCKVLADVAPREWGQVDLTDIYQAARRQCFADCPRVVIHAQPGEAYLIHRLALHGVAQWVDGADAPPEGRMIAYFRPELSDISRWLA